MSLSPRELAPQHGYLDLETQEALCEGAKARLVASLQQFDDPAELTVLGNLTGKLAGHLVTSLLVEPQAVFGAAIEDTLGGRDGLHRLSAHRARWCVVRWLSPGASFGEVENVRAEVFIDRRKRQPLTATAIADLRLSWPGRGKRRLAASAPSGMRHPERRIAAHCRILRRATGIRNRLHDPAARAKGPRNPVGAYDARGLT